MYATSASLNKIIENIALKDNVANFHWTKHLVESHSDSIEKNLQCQSLAVQEGWHYSVFNEDNTCYFGTMNAENSLVISDELERQVSINTAELASFVSETFVTRQSNIYYPYAYINFAYPMNKEHCSIHCVFDPDDKCDFFFMWNVYCYLGNFNQPDYISSSQDSVTTYIYKGIPYFSKSLGKCI